MDSIPQKVCSRCKVEKPETDYYTDKRTNRLFAHCKKCHAQINRDWRKNGPKPKPDNSQRTEKACSKCKVVKVLDDFPKRSDRPDGRSYVCKDCVREPSKQWRQANIAYLRVSRRKYQPRATIRMREYRKGNEAIKRADMRKRHRRRAQKAGSVGQFTHDEFEALCKQHANRCASCGVSARDSKLTPDHVLPLVCGGSNDIGNIQPLCLSCNCWKNDRHIDFRRYAPIHGIELSCRIR